MNEMTNAEYHADRTHLSSSALKELYKGPEHYYKKYILGEDNLDSNSPALALGTATHCAILEPHLFADTVAVFDGKQRRGKEWELFLQNNQSKTIITSAQLRQMHLMIKGLNNNRAALDLLQGCKFEHTLMSQYSEVPVKCRCDGINIEKNYIIDIKTTGYASTTEAFREVLELRDYDLSASLYMDIAEYNYIGPFDFYFVVLSKLDFQCRVYKTSDKTRFGGINKVSSAIDTYKKCKLTNNWEPVIMNITEVANEEITSI